MHNYIGNLFIVPFFEKKTKITIFDINTVKYRKSKLSHFLVDLQVQYLQNWILRAKIGRVPLFNAD